MQRRQLSYPAGFTLVELLVVIGIIAVLVSILLPALNRAKDAANTVACSSNMHQLGVAAQMYINDYKCYPPAGFVFADTRRLTWDRLLAKYLGGHVPLEYNAPVESKKFGINSMAVYRCPGDSFGIRYQGTPPTAYPDDWKQSYSAAKAFWNGTAAGPFNHKGIVDVPAGVTHYPCLGVCDWGDDTFTGTSDTSKGKQKIKYMTFVRPSQVARPSGCIMYCERMTPNNIQGDDSAIFTVNGGWQNDDSGSGKQYPLNHMKSTMMNYCFADGHVEPLKPIDTVSPVSAWKAVRKVNDADGMWVRKDGQLY